MNQQIITKLEQKLSRKKNRLYNLGQLIISDLLQQAEHFNYWGDILYDDYRTDMYPQSFMRDYPQLIHSIERNVIRTKKFHQQVGKLENIIQRLQISTAVE